MPLYEYFCDACKISFEALVLFSASKQQVETCPGCGEPPRRILSAVNFATGPRTPKLPPMPVREGKPDVTALRLPPAARLCWMDDHSAARLAAYKAGRGAEYDDTLAARKELASQRGESETPGPVQPTHSDSVLSDQAVFSNRRKAAQKEKVAESVTVTKSSGAKQSREA
jgi:putative FmdB family regulatory protein